ncbi:MAG: hypothetical protein JWM32_1461 [Verrucomicrobia bacterium]|nr:hypothetical protein [Verrucomicrobiota bacterium]
MNDTPSSDRQLRLTAGLESFGQDLRFGLRQLIKAPSFAITCIVTIALGIGACTAIYSVADKYLRHPIDYDEAEQLVWISETSPKVQRAAVSPGSLLAWQTQSSVFAELAGAYWAGKMQLTEGDRRVPVEASYLSLNYLRMLRVRPELGREFSREEFLSGKGDVAILNRKMWQNRFGGRTDVIGQIIHLNEKPYTVVGVVTDPINNYDNVLLPWDLATQTEDFTTHKLAVRGRLKPGATIAQAQAELDVIAARVAAAHPDLYKDRGVRVEGLVNMLTRVGGQFVWPLVGAAGLLLLIACVNVANLLLIRASARRREIAVRLALGARRGRLIRQLLAESLLLSAIGGTLGVLLAWSLVGPLAAASTLPRSDRVVIDGWVLATSLGLMVVTSAGIGLVPAWQATSGNLTDALNDGGYLSSGGRRQRVRSAFVVLQIASAFVLLVGTGLMVRSLQALQQFDRGLTTDPVYVVTTQLDSRRSYGTPDKIAAFSRGALERIQGLPGVMSAAFGNAVAPGRASSDGFIIEGQSRPALADTAPSTDIFAVTADYFRALGIPLISGRDLTARDGIGATSVVLINQEIARKYFPGQNPVGRQILLLGDTTWSEIIGVVGDVRNPLRDVTPQLYRPIERNTSQTLYLLLKVAHNSPALSQSVRDALASIDPAITPGPMQSLEQTLTGNWNRQRFNITLMGLFSGVALVLATLGIYGVTAYAAAQRTREIGIRMALGALPRDVLELVLYGGMRVVGIGIAVGLAAAFVSTQILGAFLYGTSAHDPMTLLAIAVILSLTSLAACLIPARRAAKIEPLIALRHD